MRNTAGVCGSDDTWSNGGQDAELGEALMSPAHRPHMLTQLVSLISGGLEGKTLGSSPKKRLWDHWQDHWDLESCLSSDLLLCNCPMLLLILPFMPLDLLLPPLSP